jgi:Cobalt transport protein
MAPKHLAFVFTPAMKLVMVLAMGVALQSGPGLWLALVASGYVALMHRVRLMKLLRRVRLLILVLFAVTLFMTPGSALFPEWGLYPTVEGLSLALTQLLRLLGMLAVVAWLLDTTNDRSLAAGALALLTPLAGQRQWPERAVARLLLVFHYLEAAPKPRNLQDVLALARQDEIDPLPGAPTLITLDSAVMTTRDVWFALGAFALAGFCLVIGGSV